MTLTKIRRMLADILSVPDEQIVPKTRLIGAAAPGALDRARLILGCEQTFHITIRDEDVDDLISLRDLSEYVDDRLKDGQDDYEAPGDDSAREAWYYE